MLVIVEITVILGFILSFFYLGYFSLIAVKSRVDNSLHNHSKMDYFPLVSVIVPTYNEENTIVNKLSDLMEQNYPFIEIIIVDGGSEDRTVELIESFVKENNLSLELVKEEERKGKASSLNEAFKHCSGEVVVITDADAMWEKNALRKIISNFSDPKIGAVTGRQILSNMDQSLSTRTEKGYRNIFSILRLGESKLDSVPIFNGPLMAFRSNSLEAIPYDTIADDSYLAVQTRKKGFRSLYETEAIFYERTPSTFKSRFVQKVRRGQGLIQMFLREWRILFNPKFGKFGMIIFPAEFFMHIVSPILWIIFLIMLLYNLFLMNIYVFVGLTIAFVFLFAISMSKKSAIVNVLWSFLEGQFLLSVSLINHFSRKSQYKWKKIDRIRKVALEVET